ncbi:MAG TPA: hypothetical protein VNX18_11550 [Bryobacteraceae bacterium]|nr:hypothetical protein [Bryobacteraceae bacterium]
MKLSIILSAGLAATAIMLAQPLPPDDATQKKIIADATAKALAYVNDLPDFVCRQVTRRNEDPKGTNQWKTMDTVNEQLTLLNRKEEYRTLSVNGKKASGENRPGGLLRSSDFANYLSWIFDPKAKAEISWSQWDALRGHRVHVLGFRVKPENSQFVISKGKGQPVTAGIFGVVSVDSESGSILKVGIIATDVPASFPVQGSAIEANYEFAKIGDHYFVVPLKADLHSKEGKMLVWTEVEYHDYRKPGAETASK